jgi:hypothetical protein
MAKTAKTKTPKTKTDNSLIGQIESLPEYAGMIGRAQRRIMLTPAAMTSRLVKLGLMPEGVKIENGLRRGGRRIDAVTLIATRSKFTAENADGGEYNWEVVPVTFVLDVIGEIFDIAKDEEIIWFDTLAPVTTREPEGFVVSVAKKDATSQNSLDDDLPF